MERNKIKIIVIKMVQYWHKDTHIDQQNRKKLRNKFIIINSMHFWQGAKNTTWRKDIVFKRQCWEN